jgi:hypothetical protein
MRQGYLPRLRLKLQHLAGLLPVMFLIGIILPHFLELVLKGFHLLQRFVVYFSVFLVLLFELEKVFLGVLDGGWSASALLGFDAENTGGW